MRTPIRSIRRCVIPVLVLAALFRAGAAAADEVKVATSGALAAAFVELAPGFEKSSQHKISTVFGASMGNTPEAIPNRLQRGEAIDVVILASQALDDLIKKGKVVAGSRVDLVRSSIGMAVRAGKPSPDIHDLQAFTRTLLNASSVAYSDSASGVFLSTTLFPRLGVADQLKGKSKQIPGNVRVGDVVARGEAEIGFQQVSELIPVKGITIVGVLPDGAQQITVFSAGIVTGSKSPGPAKTLIQYLASPAAAPTLKQSGLDPISPK